MHDQSITPSVIERIASKTDQTGDHWLWQGKPDFWGYGRLNVGNHVYHAHRLAWEAVAGPIPPRMSILHTCDIRLCVRNDDEGTYAVRGILHPRRGHLFLGTRAINLHDMYEKGRQAIIERARGADHHRTTLTEVQVIEMKALYATGTWSQTRLGHRYGITNGAVWRIVHGLNWGHVG